MTSLVCAAAGFLLAVLWFDLMFDVQARDHPTGTIPDDVRASISSYYARVTTGAAPRSKLVLVAMLALLVGLVGELVQGRVEFWRSFMSLIFAVAATGLAKWRTVPTAVRIGHNRDDAGTQSDLIRRVYGDHRSSLVFMLLVVTMHLLTW